MNDKFYMEDLLNNAKAICSLLLDGTIESATPQVTSTFNQTLFDALAVQNAIYKQMESKGWYQTQAVPQNKVAQAAAQAGA